MHLERTNEFTFYHDFYGNFSSHFRGRNKATAAAPTERTQRAHSVLATAKWLNSVKKTGYNKAPLSFDRFFHYLSPSAPSAAPPTHTHTDSRLSVHSQQPTRSQTVSKQTTDFFERRKSYNVSPLRTPLSSIPQCPPDLSPAQPPRVRDLLRLCRVRHSVRIYLSKRCCSWRSFLRRHHLNAVVWKLKRARAPPNTTKHALL